MHANWLKSPPAIKLNVTFPAHISQLLYIIYLLIKFDSAKNVLKLLFTSSNLASTGFLAKRNTFLLNIYLEMNKCRCGKTVFKNKLDDMIYCGREFLKTEQFVVDMHDFKIRELTVTNNCHLWQTS